MGLNAEITQAVVEAFDGDLADAVQAVTLVKGDALYAPETGEVMTSQDSYTTRAVVNPVDHNAVDGEAILITDTQFTILQSELTAEPEVDDYIMVGTDKYAVNVVLHDPADVIWGLVGRMV